MGLLNLWSLLAAAAAAASLVACSSLNLVQPIDGSTIKLPAQTAVDVTASPSMSGLQVTVDGNDVSGQINYVSDSESRGQLSLPAGRHTVGAAATVPCWYCSPQATQLSIQAKVCVADVPSLTASETAIANSDSLVWSKTSDTSISVAADGGTALTRWNVTRLGGIASSFAIISSIDNSCLCMRSMDASQSTPIGLAVCDGTDPLQQWQFLAIPSGGPNAFRVQNNGRGISDACLTENPSDHVLVQLACNDTPNQLWKFRNNTTGQVGPPF